MKYNNKLEKYRRWEDTAENCFDRKGLEDIINKDKLNIRKLQYLVFCFISCMSGVSIDLVIIRMI